MWSMKPCQRVTPVPAKWKVPWRGSAEVAVCAAARTAQGFVSRGCDEVRTGDRIMVQTGRYQTGKMRHVDHQLGTDLLRNLGK